MTLRKKHVYTLCFVFAFLLFVSLVSTVSYLNIRDGTSRKAAHITTSEYGDPISSSTEKPIPIRSPNNHGHHPNLTNWHGIYMFTNITKVDPLHSKLYITFKFYPSGPLLLPTNKRDNRGRIITHPIQVVLDDRIVDFEPEQSMSSIENHFSFFDGSINRYPFDSYKSEIKISAYLIENSHNASNSGFVNVRAPSTLSDDREVNTNQTRTRTPIPIIIEAYGALQGYSLSLKYKEISQTTPMTSIAIFTTVERSAVWIGFALFIQVTMWILSSSVALMAISILVRGIKVLPAMLGICTAMLFALPSLRNQQPGSPPIGSLSDTVGFFWNMLFASMATLSMMIKFTYDQYKESNVDHQKQHVVSSSPGKDTIKNNDGQVMAINQRISKHRRHSKDEVHMVDPMMIGDPSIMMLYEV